MKDKTKSLKTNRKVPDLASPTWFHLSDVCICPLISPSDVSGLTHIHAGSRVKLYQCIRGDYGEAEIVNLVHNRTFLSFSWLNLSIVSRQCCCCPDNGLFFNQSVSFTVWKTTHVCSWVFDRELIMRVCVALWCFHGSSYLGLRGTLTPGLLFRVFIQGSVVSGYLEILIAPWQKVKGSWTETGNLLLNH